MNTLTAKIEQQIKLLTEEHQRVKVFINESEFDCTTAPFVLAKEYRDKLKQHIKVLQMNLED